MPGTEGMRAGGLRGHGTTPVDHAGAPLTAIDDRVILDELSDAVVAADDGNRIVYCNPAAERLLGWASGDLQGRSLLTIVPERFHEAHLAGFSRFLLTNEPRLVGTAVRVPAVHREGHEVEVELTLAAFRTGDERQLFVASLRDLTDRVQLERQTAMTSYFRATTEVAVLLGLSGTVSSLETAAPMVLQAIGTSLDWPVGALWLVDGDRLRCLDAWAASDIEGADLQRLTRTLTFKRGVGMPGKVWETGEPVWVQDIADTDLPRGPIAADLGLHAVFGFPVMSEGRFLGVIEFFHREARSIDADLLGVVATIGAQLGQFVERRRAEQELRASSERFATLARTLQASLLPPHLPDIPGLDLAAAYRPAGVGAEVGGDFYDLFPTRGSAWGIVIGDVCGKGAEAATATALARYTTRAAVMRARRPRNVLATLNEAMIRQDEEGRFITITFASIRPHDNHAEVVISLGGHPQPVLLNAHGRASFVGKPGTVLGVVDKPDLYDHSVNLGPGDALVFYTDGVTEARGPQGQFGDERLLAAVAQAAGGTAEAIVEVLQDTVESFEDGASRDDLAVLVVRVPAD